MLHLVYCFVYRFCFCSRSSCAAEGYLWCMSRICYLTRLCSLFLFPWHVVCLTQPRKPADMSALPGHRKLNPFLRSLPKLPACHCTNFPVAPSLPFPPSKSPPNKPQEAHDNTHRMGRNPPRWVVCATKSKPFVQSQSFILVCRVAVVPPTSHHE